MNIKKPTIIHLAKWYPNKEDTLAGIFVKRHIQSTLSAYHAIVIYAQSSENINGLYEITNLEEDGIEVKNIYYRKYWTHISTIDRMIKLVCYFLLVFNAFIKIKKKNVIVLIHVHVMGRTSMIAWLIKKWFAIPYIISEHWSLFTRKNGFPDSNKKKLYRISAKESSAILTVSQDLEKGMQQNGMECANYYRIFNNVNIQIFHPKLKESTKVEAHKRFFLHVAEFDNTPKQTTEILKVCHDLVANNLEFELHLVGYGQDEGLVLAVAKELHLLDKCVFFHGKLTGVGLAEMYRKADYFVLFSDYENLPCVIPESFCVGLPIIATKVGGIPEIVDTSRGILIPRGDKKSLFATMKNEILNPTTWDHEAIIKYGIDNFSTENIGNQIVTIYQKYSL